MMVKAAKSDEPLPTRKNHQAELDRFRAQIAKIIRVVFLLCAVILALGAVLVAFRNNVSESNGLVKFVMNLADAIDGPFSRDNGIFDFSGKNAVTKEAVTNWGLGAIVYLVIGRILDRLVTPNTVR